MKPAWIVLAIVVIVALVYFLTMAPSTTVPAGSAPVAGAPSDAAADSANTVSFEVSAENFSFNPSTIRVKSGQIVHITLKSVGGTHDLRIDGIGIATGMVASGMTDAVEFKAPAAGQYEYYCSVGNHRAMGMKGTLIVE